MTQKAKKLQVVQPTSDISIWGDKKTDGMAPGLTVDLPGAGPTDVSKLPDPFAGKAKPKR